MGEKLLALFVKTLKIKINSKDLNELYIINDINKCLNFFSTGNVWYYSYLR